MVSRRDFIKRTGKAVAASAVLGAGYLLADSRPDFELEETAEILKLNHTVGGPELFRKLAVIRDDTPVNLVEKAIAALGGIGVFVAKGDKVLVKPNVGWDRTPEQAANTNPEMVGHVVKMCLGAGASEVVVTDITCNDPRRTFLRSGIQEAAEKAGAKVVIGPETEDVNLGGGVLSEWPVIQQVMWADKIINMPITKHHGLSRATIGMKNLYGIIGGRRHQLHQSIDQSIVDLAAFAMPTLVIADCYRVLMRNGPVGGSLEDVREVRTVVAGVDQIAVDSFASQFLEIDAGKIGYIPMGDKLGLGKMDLAEKTIIDG